MKEIQIYLAGKMGGISFEEQNAWREEIKKHLITFATISGTKANVINPVDYFNFERQRHKSEIEVMKFDLSKVKKSDIVIVNVEGLDTSIGSMIEIYEAYKNDIPVIAYDENGMCEKLHPWLKCCITRTEDSLGDLVGYIRDFYMI